MADCRRALRSAVTIRLVVPSVKLSTVGSRAFPVAAAQLELYRNTSSQLPRCSPSGVTWKRLTTTIFLPIVLYWTLYIVISVTLKSLI